MNASSYVNLAVQMFQRTNPLGEIVAAIQSFANLILNYNSTVKLNKFRHNLYVQQLRRMEGFLSQESPYEGVKINRQF